MTRDNRHLVLFTLGYGLACGLSMLAAWLVWRA